MPLDGLLLNETVSDARLKGGDTWACNRERAPLHPFLGRETKERHLLADKFQSRGMCACACARPMRATCAAWTEECGVPRVCARFADRVDVVNNTYHVLNPK